MDLFETLIGDGHINNFQIIYFLQEGKRKQEQMLLLNIYHSAICIDFICFSNMKISSQ